MTEQASDLMKRVAKATELSILEQMNEFVKRGLIVIEQVGPTLYEDPTQPYTLKVHTSVKLKLKEQEYIEKLERENQFYKDQIAEIKSWVSARLVDKNA